MEFRILGPLEVADGETLLSLGAEKQRAVLTLLLLNANKTVSRDQLIDELWGGEPPEKAVKAIQTYVSRLRKLLPPEVLRTRPRGYVLEVEPEQLDLHRFERLLAAGQQALADNEPKTASTSLRDALSLWRGPALAEFESAPFARSEGARLEELRLYTLEERIDADLRLGRHADLVGELESLVARYPLRERLRGQLMLALYRSGRQAEALNAYQDARSTLVDELGIDISRQLQDLEQAILRHDPALELEIVAEPVSAEAATPAELDAAKQLPRRPGAGDLDVGFGTFVGRERELERLRLILDDALAGRGRLVMLAGEPGIGKTRTAVELTAYAEERGARALSGRCYEREGAPPYWPWVQALRGYVRLQGPERLRAELGPGAPEIGEIIPEVSERLPDLPAPPETSDPAQARFRLFDSITAFLGRATEDRPLLIVLDDLHSADNGSLMLLEFVAGELASMRVMVLGTYRDVEISRRHPLSPTLAELNRARLFDRIPLRGLDEQDVERFVETAAGLKPPADLVTPVHAQTEGNPLFLTEVLRLLAQEGELTAERLRSGRTWSVRIPEGVREVIGRRLDRRSDRCNEVLVVASVIGREFQLDQLSRLIDDLSEDELLELLEEALGAHLIEESSTVVGRYAFTHGLIQETLTEEVSATRRVRLHAQIATTLEELYGEDATQHPAELAHHFAEAEAVLGAEKLAKYSRIAGERALASYAYEEALAHFGRALAAKGEESLDAETASLLFGLGRAQLATRERHELDEALESITRAFDYYADAGRVENAVAIATHPFPPSLMYAPTGVIRLISRALDLAGPESAEAGRLLCVYGWFLGINGADYVGAREAFDRAARIAKKTADPSLEIHVRVNAEYVDMFHLRWDGCLDNGLRAAELAAELDDRRNEMAARGWASRALAFRGDLREARSQAGATLASADRLRERYWIATTRLHAAVIAFLEGQWAQSREFSDAGLAAQPRDPRLLGLRAMLESELGEHAVATTYVERLQEAMGAVPPPGPGAEHPVGAASIALACHAAGIRTHFGTVESAARNVLSLDRTPPYLELLSRISLGLATIQAEDAAAAGEVYEKLQAYQGGVQPVPPFAIDRILGLVAKAAGRLEDATRHLEFALAFSSDAGYRPMAAWAAVDLSGALALRDDPGDSERIGSLRQSALEIAEQLEMRSLLQRLDRSDR